jgi:kumamolisin
MNVRLSESRSSQQRPVLPPHSGSATGIPGEYTVGDVANFYDINPLYKAGINGRGQTVGIATLANFLPSDAYAYWSLIGLKILPNRITQVHVDGGGELSADAGSGETSLDVEQSGGLAPNAKIIVYDAPNTNPGFIDLFYKAASDNLVDSLSVSWGQAEIYYFETVGGEDDTGQFPVFHQAFLELAAQSISTLATAGDSGAYDPNVGYNLGYTSELNNVLGVDSPGADPVITAAGGTTRPFVLPAVEFPALPPPPPTVPPIPPTAPPLIVTLNKFGAGITFKTIPLNLVGRPTRIFGFLAAASVSSGRCRPTKVIPLASAALNPASAPSQTVRTCSICRRISPVMPDVSLNADPFSGYLLLSTEDGGLSDFWGGTSFAAPQLNGISALISQATGGGRLGLWNPMLYRFQQNYGYGNASPLVDIAKGDNWFYYGIPGYEPGAGLGVLDVAKLAAAVARDSQPGYPPRNSAP